MALKGEGFVHGLEFEVSRCFLLGQTDKQPDAEKKEFHHFVLNVLHTN